MVATLTMAETDTVYISIICHLKCTNTIAIYRRSKQWVFIMLNKRQQSICLIQPSFLRATFTRAIDILLNSCTNVEAFYLSFTQGMIPKYKCVAQFFTYIWGSMVWLSTECILNYFTIPVSVLHYFVGFWYRDEYLRTTYQKYNLYSLSTEAFLVLKIRPKDNFLVLRLSTKKSLGIQSQLYRLTACTHREFKLFGDSSQFRAQ